MNTTKKEWGNIVAKVQTFVPQEYCDAGCYRPITDRSTWNTTTYNSHEYTYKFIDLDGDGYTDTGERFYIATGMSASSSSISNQTTEGAVQIYRRGTKTGETTTYGNNTA